MKAVLPWTKRLVAASDLRSNTGLRLLNGLKSGTIDQDTVLNCINHAINTTTLTA